MHGGNGGVISTTDPNPSVDDYSANGMLLYLATYNLLFYGIQEGMCMESGINQDLELFLLVMSRYLFFLQIATIST